jgi:hypothetical protein
MKRTIDWFAKTEENTPEFKDQGFNQRGARKY